MPVTLNGTTGATFNGGAVSDTILNLVYPKVSRNSGNNTILINPRTNIIGSHNIHTVTISANENNIILANKAAATGWNLLDFVLLVINSGVTVSSTSDSTPAILIDNTLTRGCAILNNGFIYGHGGTGGLGGSYNGSGTRGRPGGTAIRVGNTMSTVTISNLGTIAGGGGGGGGGGSGSGGGGKESFVVGGGGGGGGISGAVNSSGGLGGFYSGSSRASTGGGGTTSAGGTGGNGNYSGSSTSSYKGGNGASTRGTQGSTGSGGDLQYGPYPGGGGGAAVEGLEYISFVNTGTILGQMR
jgi:hypothetical protein